MPEKESSRSSRSRGATTPEGYPTVPPSVAYPSGDYSYTLEVVMEMQKTLGQLTQAIATLTEQGKEHGRKLEDACKDIHAAKVVVGVVCALVVAASTVLGFIAKAAIDYFSRMPAK